MEIEEKTQERDEQQVQEMKSPPTTKMETSTMAKEDLFRVMGMTIGSRGLQQREATKLMKRVMVCSRPSCRRGPRSVYGELTNNENRSRR